MIRNDLKVVALFAVSLLVGVSIWSATDMRAFAQASSTDQIVHTLAPPLQPVPAASVPGATPAASANAPAASGAGAIPFVTRNLSIKRNPALAQPAANDPDSNFVESLRRRAQSLTVEEGDRVAEIAKNRTKIDLDIDFDYGTAAIAAKAVPQVDALGAALRTPQLQGAVLVVSGHTDGKGSDQYNQDLSVRRAEAVKSYLVSNFKISPDNLITAGYGKRALKNKADPYAAENRRVEVVNMSATLQANR